jgi:transcriptional regulator with XRE-family HTH domain
MDELTSHEAKRLGELIRHRRSELGLSFDDLIEQAHIERWQLEGIERGQLKDTSEPEVLRAIAFALKLSPVDLYEEVGRDWRLNRIRNA